MLIINVVKPKNFFELVENKKLELKHLEKFAYVISSDNEKELDRFDRFVGEIINHIIESKTVVVKPEAIQDIFNLYTEYETRISKYMDILIETSTILGIINSSDENTFRMTTKRYTQGPGFIHLYANYELSERVEDVFLEYNRKKMFEAGTKLKKEKEKEDQKNKQINILEKIEKNIRHNKYQWIIGSILIPFIIFGLTLLVQHNTVINDTQINATLIGENNNQIIVNGDNNYIISNSDKKSVESKTEDFQANLGTNDVWNIATDYTLNELCSQEKYSCYFGPGKPKQITYWSDEMKSYTGDFYYKEFTFNLGNKKYIENLDMQIQCDNNKLFGIRMLSEITDEAYLDDEAAYVKIKKMYPEQVVKFYLFWKSQIDSCTVRFLQEGSILQEIKIVVQPIVLG